MSDPLPQMPHHVEAARLRARKLEWWTIGVLVSIIVVMGFAMGGSQAMRTAWIEDTLSLLPPIVFLIADQLERRGPSAKYPYGLARANTLAFFAAACALSAMGGLLIYDAVMTLVRGEHPTIGSVRLFGTEVWMGWIMIAALSYSVVGPVILGRLKAPVAETLHDEVLHTDALMNAADWQTGVAGIVGILGLGLGFWWADAAAAGLIALSILWDGVNALSVSTAELLDGAPRKLGSREIDPAAKRIVTRLRKIHKGANIQIRQTGRFMRAAVEPGDEPHIGQQRAEELAGPEQAWRLIEVTHAERGLPKKQGGKRKKRKNRKN